MEEISKFLYAIPKGTAGENNGKHEILENRKLELRLAPPGQEQPMLSLHGAKRGILHEGTNRSSPAQDQRSAKNCRVEKSPVIGWPPVRSSRKNATASGSVKQAGSKLTTSMITEEKDDGSSEKPKDALFVKVNMEGVPIGRKVDLTVYDNYEALYSGVDALFTGLLAGNLKNITKRQHHSI